MRVAFRKPNDRVRSRPIFPANRIKKYYVKRSCLNEAICRRELPIESYVSGTRQLTRISIRCPLVGNGKATSLLEF